MSKRLIMVVLGVLVVVVYAMFSHFGEPSYQGRSLGSWVGVRGKEFLFTQPAASQEAMRHMGTNAIPYLLRWVEAEDPLWKERLRQKVQPVFKQVGIPMPPTRTFGGSLFGSALSYIGPDARLAIPHLGSLMQTSTSEVVTVRAAECLVWLGEQGVPPFLTVITNQAAKFRPECICEQYLQRLSLWG